MQNVLTNIQKNGIESELKFSTQMFGSDGTWYGDGRGGTQSELITELYDANDATYVKIWFKADANVSPHDIAHTAALVLGNVEFYGNGANFNGTEFSIDTTSGETTFNQKAQSFSAFDCRNIKFWGANTKGFDIKISVDNCENTSEMYFMSFPIGQIATAKLDVTVKKAHLEQKEQYINHHHLAVRLMFSSLDHSLLKIANGMVAQPL